MNFVQNIIWNSVEGFVEAGTRTAGGYAGDALLKAGDLIEGAGRSVGNGLERTASGYGSKISGGAPAPTVAKKPGVKRSHSSPASTKARGPASKTPLGANKYPGGKTVGAGTKQLSSSAKSTVGGAQKTIGGTATKAIGGSGLPKAAAKTTPLPKAYPNNVPYGTTTKPSAITSGKGVSVNKANSLPKPYQPPSGPEKKTAVRPGGAIKPFNPTGANNNSLAGAKPGGGADKPYPGTNTLPGQANKTPVRAQKYKPIERMKPQVEKGKVQHFAV